MKKICAVILILFSAAAFLCSCAEKPADGMSGFSSPSVIFDALDSAKRDFMTAAAVPSDDSAVDGKIEWIPAEEDEENVVYPNVWITGSYLKETGVFGAQIRTNESKLDVYSDESGTILNGSKLRINLTLYDVFTKYFGVFTQYTNENDYATLPDSIRVSDKDEEVSRITLTLPKERAAEALKNAVMQFKDDPEAYGYIYGLLSLYSNVHLHTESGHTLLNNVLLDGIDKIADNMSGDLVWVRYVKNGKTVAADLNLPSGGEIYRFYYTCPIFDAETELRFTGTRGGEELFECYYLFRHSDVSNTYKLQITAKDLVTTFDGEVKTALKSGSVSLQLYATKNSDTVTGVSLYLSYNGMKGLKYKGNGHISHGGRRCGCTLTLDLVPSDRPDTPEKPQIMVYTNDYQALYNTLTDSFYDIVKYVRGEDVQ